MINICIKDIVEATKGKLLCGDEKQQIDHLSIDSRSSQGNDLFIPIIGAKVDAHRFIDGAFSVGCVATLTSEHDSMDDPNHAWIRVEDTVLALHEIGKLCRSRVTVPAIGVTGSVGKTTTREMIAYALSAEKKVYKTQKNYNSSVGLPITMSLMSNDYDIAVLELGMNVPGELGTISEIAQLKMAVLTNVGVAHIEFYGSQEAICHEKYTISKGFGKEGLLIVNGDDELLYKFRESTGYPYVLYGTKEYCDYRAEDIHMENGHYAFTFVHNEMRVPVVLSVLGQHNVLNATAALAAAHLNGVDVTLAAKSLYTFTGFQNRLQIMDVKDYKVIDDTYNASPASMVAGVNVLGGFETSGRRIAVLSEMRELGENTLKYHREVGEKIASEPINELIVIGDTAKAIADGARQKNCSYLVHEFDDKMQAAEYLNQNLKAGDVLIGMASSGVHSNGFSLVRKVFEMTKESLDTYYEELGTTLGEALIAPTRIYVKALKSIKDAGVRIHACSHITGGGFYENVPRMLNEGTRAIIEKDSYPVLPIFDLLAKKGNIEEKMMYNTFNMGLGMVLAVDPSDVDKTMAAIREAGDTPYVVGRIENGEKGVTLC